MTQLVDDYLDRLERAADHLPRSRRKELVEDIEAHLAEALGPFPTEVDVRNVLERLGTPEEIVDAEGPRPVAAPPPRLQRFPASPVPPAPPRPRSGALEVAGSSCSCSAASSAGSAGSVG